MAVLVDAPQRCQCSPECSAAIKTPGGRFAWGHNPRTRENMIPGGVNRARRLGKVTLRCRRCGERRSLPLSAARQRKSYDQVTGAYMCRKCQNIDRLKNVARPRLAWHYGSNDTSDEKAARAEHMKTVIRGIGGRKVLDEKRDAAHKRGLSERGRLKLSANLLVSKARSGDFQLCPECDRLIYLQLNRVRAGAHGMHKACWRRLQNSERFREWRRRLGRGDSPLYRARLAQNPIPLKKQGRGYRVSSEQWNQRLTWLLRRFVFRESFRGIAVRDGKAVDTVAHGIHALIAVLPDTWDEVWGGTPSAKSWEKLAPLSRLRQ